MGKTRYEWRIELQQKDEPEGEHNVRVLCVKGLAPYKDLQEIQKSIGEDLTHYKLWKWYRITIQTAQ